MNIGKTWAGRACAAVGLVVVATFASSGIAAADDIYNTLDASIDATAESMSLTVGQADGTTTLKVDPANGDGKNGCNLTSDSTLKVRMNSSDAAVATASLATTPGDTFSSCGDIKTVTVHALTAGSATISVSPVSNTTGATFNFTPATFTVNVAAAAPTNTAPVVGVTGVTNNATYEAGAVPTAGCSVVDAEDTNESATPVITPGPTNHHGLGTFTATCSYTDNGPGTPLNRQASATYTVVDTTRPVITLVSRSQPAGPWTNQNVSLVWSCTDGSGSGVDTAASTLSRTVSTEGENQTSTGTCVDNAGNRASDTVTNIDIDKTAPVIALSNRSHPAGTWTNQNVSLIWTCTDIGSGVNAAASTLTATVSDEGSNQTTGVCVDNAGNRATNNQADIDIDKTDPVITFVSRSQPAGAWTNQSVNLVWSCTDGNGSGVNAAASKLSDTVSTEGEDQESTGTCVDNAGNTASDTVSNIDIDKTKPTINFASRSDTAGTWGNQDVVVEWTCSDNTDGSGIDTAASEPTQTLTADGADQTATGTCVDNAGNRSSDTVNDIDIDKTKPVITFVSRSQPVGPWTNQSVILAWSCTDTDGSGVNTAASELSKTVSTEGEDQQSTGTCVDNAGNTASDTVTDIDIDKTKPVVSDDVSITGTKGNSDWYTSDVGVTFTGTDALSGPPTATQKVTSNGQGTAVRVQSPAFTDNAGNSSDVGTVTKFFQIDKESPTVGNAVLVTGTMGDNDWYKSDVTVSFTATDNVSGVVGDRTRNVTSSQQGTGIVLESPAFSDVAGNTRAAGSRSFTVKVDSLAPSVSLLSGPTAGSSYFFGSVPAAPTCGANDATPGSGLADADGAATGQQDCVVKGYGTSVGPHTVTATATDNAGNTTTVSRTYTVGAWTTKGFYSPVDMGGVYNTVKGGSTVPLKFELFAGATELTDVAAVDTFTTSKITCGTDVVTDTVEITSTGGTSLRYDATGGQFIQNWKTPATVGTCYKTTMTAADGSKISALFKIK